VEDDELRRVQALRLLSALHLLAELLDATPVDALERHDSCKCHFTLLAAVSVANDSAYAAARIAACPGSSTRP
jgi:hypothetical protein